MVAATKQDTVRLFVYALCEPDGKTIRYIGLTGNIWKRLLNHYRHSCMPKVREWINALRSRGLVPSIVVLREVVGVENGTAAEAEEIAKWRNSIGDQLLNERETGCGVTRTRRGQVKFDGKSKTLSQWAAHLGISRQALNLRLQRHPMDVALSRGREQSKRLGATTPPPKFDQGGMTMAVDERFARRTGLNHDERRERRRLIAEVVFQGGLVADVAKTFGVTTATVYMAMREFDHESAPSVAAS